MELPDSFKLNPPPLAESLHVINYQKIKNRLDNFDLKMNSFQQINFGLNISNSTNVMTNLHGGRILEMFSL